MHTLNKIEDELYKIAINNNQLDGSKRVMALRKKKNDIIIQDKLEEARMEREERVITNAFVNYIVPLAIIGLMANFIPPIMIIVPVEEEDMCWFYFLTKSPYQLDYVENWLYYTSMISRYIIIIIEISIMLYFTRRIRDKEMVLKQINFPQESLLTTILWISTVIIGILLQLAFESIPPGMLSDIM